MEHDKIKPKMEHNRKSLAKVLDRFKNNPTREFKSKIGAENARIKAMQSYTKS